jgi:hypothetical protein
VAVVVAPAEEQAEGRREAWAAAVREVLEWDLEVQVRAWEAVMRVEAVQEWEAGPAHPEWEAVARVIPVQG